MTPRQKQAVRRLNWGSGGDSRPGWINSDVGEYSGVDVVCDIRKGLPIETDSIDYAVSVHALPEIAYSDLPVVLEELRRVLKPGAPLRLSVPDLEKSIAAYQSNDRDYFLIPDEDAKSIGSKLIVQLVWYGYSRTLFTHDFLEEQLYKAEFSSVVRCSFNQTASPFPEITELDGRQRESLFVEAVK